MMYGIGSVPGILAGSKKQLGANFHQTTWWMSWLDWGDFLILASLGIIMGQTIIRIKDSYEPIVSRKSSGCLMMQQAVLVMGHQPKEPFLGNYFALIFQFPVYLLVESIVT